MGYTIHTDSESVGEDYEITSEIEFKDGEFHSTVRLVKKVSSPLSSYNVDISEYKESAQNLNTIENRTEKSISKALTDIQKLEDAEETGIDVEVEEIEEVID